MRELKFDISRSNYKIKLTNGGEMSVRLRETQDDRDPEIVKSSLDSYKSVLLLNVKGANKYVRNIIRILENGKEKDNYVQIKRLLDNVISFINK